MGFVWGAGHDDLSKVVVDVAWQTFLPRLVVREGLG